MLNEFDDQVTAHRETVRELMRPGQVLAVDSPYGTTMQRAWFTAPDSPTPERRAMHRRLLEEFRAEHPDVEAGRQAIVLAGPPGAGKSTVLRSLLGEQGDRWLVVDADEFKHRLLTEAMADGTYEAVIKPDEIKAREAAGEPFAPLELASLVHEESSQLASTARNAAIADGLNVVVDTVLSKESSAAQLASQLTRAGYAVRVVDVECSYDASAARVESRWRQVTRDYLQDPDRTGLGGRWVPSEYARSVFPPELGGRSLSEGVARTLAERCPAVTRYEVHRVADPAASPVLESALERTRPGGPLLDPRTAGAAARLQAGTSARAAGPSAQPDGRAAGPRPSAPDRGIDR